MRSSASDTFDEKPSDNGDFGKSKLQLFTGAHPILDCRQASAYEAELLNTEGAEWNAMQAAGAALKQGIERDYLELGPLPERLRVLVLVGKGNNTGDALIAAAEFLADYPRARVHLLLVEPHNSIRPLPARALADLQGRVCEIEYNSSWSMEACHQRLNAATDGEGYHICLDGLVGLSFKPPLRPRYAALIESINGYQKIGLRAAVDLPSGCSTEIRGPVFQANMSYATGIAKAPLFYQSDFSSRVRYLDLGFFDKPENIPIETTDAILLPTLLNPLRALRPAHVDKRSFGHLFIVGGSSFMPGALLMSAQAALRSGVGLVTAFAPASVAAALAAKVPEAIWVPWPETASGTLCPKALHLLTERMERADALLIGPGMDWNRDTEILTQEVLSAVNLPLIIDADALQSQTLDGIKKRKPGSGPVVLTPHMGEFMRVAKLNKPEVSSESLLSFCRRARVTLVLKGPQTRICNGRNIFISTHGGPVLSRGGSGDLLAGIMGGMIAQENSDLPIAAARAVLLHGLAAERLAQTRGQVAVSTTEVLNYLAEVLREPT